VVMLKLINDKSIMGKFANGRIMNILSWITVVVLIILTIILVLTSVFPGIFQ
jgi:Mn2+/Fe2+ NRAMP family transporter